MGATIKGLLLTVVIIGVFLWVINTGWFQAASVGLKNFIVISSSSPLFATHPATGPTITPVGPTIGPVTGSETSGINPQNIPAGFTASQISPFYEEIRLGGVASLNGQVSLYASFSQNETIDVTGWEIKTNRGGEYIPQAVNIYTPSGVSAAADIRMKPGDTLNMYGNSSPVNLRLNECIGYLNETNQFNPAFPSSCPIVDRSEIQSFSGSCQAYIMSLGSCALPDMRNPQIPTSDYSCQNYLENHFSYNTCFNEHENDSNFLSNEIRVWMGANPFDQLHDHVLLLDRNGLLVDQYAY